MKKLLDLFCGAGGAGMGYHRAGFKVVGVDVKPQKNYPFTFHCADAFEFLAQHGHEFDVIHASPPCQAYSVSTADPGNHPDYIPLLRPMIQQAGKPYVIENVLGAPLHFPITLCATMFGLSPSIQGWYLRRHRLFESSIMLLSPGGCSCDQVTTAQVTGHLHQTGQSGMRHRKPGRDCAAVMMGIDWMTTKELTESIPPSLYRMDWAQTHRGIMSRNIPRMSESDLEAAKQRMLGRGSVIVRHTETAREASRSNTPSAGGIAGAIPAPSPITQSFTLYGQLCSGKNQVQLIWRNGKVCKYPNKTFTNWRAKAHQDILNQGSLRLRIEVPVVLTCHYTPGDLRTRDITGQQDAIFHLLVYAKVIKDDGLVYETHWYRLPMNRKAPQVMIVIQLWKEQP